MNENLIEALSEQKIFPIIRSNNPDTVVNTVEALLKGGLKIMEVNVEAPRIYDAISSVSKHADICAGGIITSMQAHAAIMAGAKCFSSPIFHMNLVRDRLYQLRTFYHFHILLNLLYNKFCHYLTQ